MKFIIDKMPKYKHECIFCKPHYEQTMLYTCKIDNKNCNLQENVDIQRTPCRWLKENEFQY